MNTSCHIIIFFIIIVLSGCKQEDPEDPRLMEFLNDPTQPEYDILIVPAEETITLRNQDQVKVKEYARIEGTLVIEETPSDRFSLQVEGGDLTISGKIILRNSPADGNSGRLQAAQNLDAPSLQLGAYAANAVLHITNQVTLQTDHGKDAATQILTGANPAGITGNSGGKGGDILLEAPNGRVKLDFPSSKPMFNLGNGGNGADIMVDRAFSSNSEEVNILAGNGGNGGKIIFNTSIVENIIDLSELVDQGNFYTVSGKGGKGGNVLWDNTSQGINMDLAEISQQSTSRVFSLRGGNGGASIQFAGSGGWAVYWSDRPINPVGQRITAISVEGGDGGNIIDVRIPQHEVIAGDGGGVVAWGNSGWDGNQSHKNGADGSEIFFNMGNGGDVEQGVKADVAIAGSGGHSQIAESEFPYQLRDMAGLKDMDHFNLNFAIVGGNGGNGNSNCQGCPGGDGGNSSQIIWGRGGNGGHVLNNPLSQGQAGNGGNIWGIIFGIPGEGGDGFPPGSAGCVPLHYFEPGQTGDGDFNFSSEAGQWLAQDALQLYEQNECNTTDGESCGEGLTCQPVHTDTLPGCWFREGATYSWKYDYVMYDYSSGEQEELSRISEQGIAYNEGGSKWRYEFTQTRTYKYGPSATYTHENASEHAVRHFGAMTGALCQEGEILLPGSSRVIIIGPEDNPGSRESIVYGGCIPRLEDLYTQNEIQKMYDNCN
ncbi:MAG: hypothetical protein ACNS62_02445 [Candidatus Cyclobacteriaceae bacterium M3_2C_046]